MTTYAKLEVNPDGKLLQSSYEVAPDGVLPSAQRSSKIPDSLKTYSLTPFPRSAVVALTGPEESMRITGIFFPTHLHGWQHLKLLGPIAAIAIALYGIIGLLFIQNTFDSFSLALLSLAVVVVIILIVFAPAVSWFKYMYYQGAPTYRVQRKVQQNYPDIPIYHDKETFLLDTYE